MGFVAFLSGLIQILTSLLIYVIFSDEPYSEELLIGLKRWRESEGHDLNNVDPAAQVSLVSRVCNFDPALSVSTSQQSLLAEITDYKKPAKIPFFGGGFEMEFVPVGWLLCLVAVLLWTMCIANEFFQTYKFFLAICSMPKKRKTVLALTE